MPPVSSAEKRKTLDSQAERVTAFCAAKGRRMASVVTECGSGGNNQRPQVLALPFDAGISHLVVEHKDRCSRFVVTYIQTLLRSQGRELVIVNEAEVGQEDLMQDFVAIIAGFLCPALWPQASQLEEDTQFLAALAVN
ncbi:MAG TPA: recombinase family protein [Ktedonobacterales bacterium]|nr:recombinase family protein [Ktedonobacterales bacterium]